MAAAFQDIHLPLRSISLPSRLEPTSLKSVSELKKLKSCCSWTTNSETIQSNMTRLAEIVVTVQELVNSPLTHQALRKNQGGRSLVEEALDGSMAVIDACSYARELVLAMREQVQELQSALRRNRASSSSCVVKQIQGFFCFRKKAKRDTAKHLRQLKNVAGEDHDSSPSSEAASSHLEIVNGVLKEVNQISVSIVKTVLEFLSMAKAGASSGRGWSIVSRLMLSSAEKSSQQRPLTELETVDSDLSSLLVLRGAQMMKKDDMVKMTRKRLETLDSCIGGFEPGLECLFKGLIQYRVSLLNVVTF